MNSYILRWVIYYLLLITIFKALYLQVSTKVDSF